jgi:predicted ferric reductase
VLLAQIPARFELLDRLLKAISRIIRGYDYRAAAMSGPPPPAEQLVPREWKPFVAARTRGRSRPQASRPVVADLLAALAGIGLGISIALAITAESSGSLRAAGGVLTALGRGTGLLSAYAMAIVVLLSARIAPLERAIGQDRLIVWHRRLGPWGLYLLLAHVVLIILGYAAAAHQGLLREIWVLLTTYSGMLPAAMATILLAGVGVTSYRRARRRMKHETWWAIHLYTYLALFLAYFHEVDTGASFVGHSVARAWWLSLWVGTLAAVAGFRIVLPLCRSVRHQLRVVAVYPEAPNTWSVLMEGRHLDQLPVAGGQFLQWRFLRRGQWWQAHPYSLSAVPANGKIRITVKELGDHSTGLAELPPGTRVAFEGPYGVFTAEARRTDKVLLIGAGVGTTPIRALLEDLPPKTNVVVILRDSRPENLVLRTEFEKLVHRRGGRLHLLVGSRRQVPLNTAALRALVPDVATRDVYLCGPDAFTDSVVEAALGAGVPEKHIHHESFAF